MEEGSHSENSYAMAPVVAFYKAASRLKDLWCVPRKERGFNNYAKVRGRLYISELVLSTKRMVSVVST
jgi:hypothetical protein